MLKKIAATAAAWVVLTGMQAAPAAQAEASLSLWRLDCGTILIKDYNSFFSDTHAYPAGQAKEITDSCYLIRHGSRYFLWDTGLPAGLVGQEYDAGFATLSLGKNIVQQLSEIGVEPGQIEMIGISHWHFDHVGQAQHFPGARLLIGKGDAEALRATPAPDEDSVKALAHWLTGDGKLEAVAADHDVFGDGRVMMLKTPGHTAGHNALLVRLASGPVLLTGDLYHFTEQVAHRGMPPWNHDRADTLASMDRFDKLAKNLGAKVIIQHEAADIAKLPAFPEAAQ